MAKTRHKNPRTAMRYIKPGGEVAEGTGMRYIKPGGEVAEGTGILGPSRRKY